MKVRKIVPRILKNLRDYKKQRIRSKYGEPISKHQDGAILYRKPCIFKYGKGDIYGYGTEKNLVDKDGNILRQIISDKRKTVGGEFGWIVRQDAKNIKKVTPNILSGDVMVTVYPTKEFKNKGANMFGGEEYRPCVRELQPNGVWRSKSDIEHLR